ncbi:hypothetical protein Pan216_33370 [Planctomycetes bacterium Pan216]|uniref:DUF1552 domain-containing protein n=1 Tax=Kolteria novifilia TaxID=2527975 RepID=A0A518B669_9BACT|nr:hypothetical protein Pan216_33370 [Planctomycetes bacterium Pan216]
MSSPRGISRRNVLKGLGTAIALPWLESVAPRAALAAAPTPPTRLAFFFVPNGVNQETWTPKREGFRYDLTPALEPLARLQDHVSVLTGLTHDKGRSNGDGAGDHARAASVFLTGTQPVKDSGRVMVGRSIDQVAAEHLGGSTRFASLELGCDRGRDSGQCDSGYSCAYSSNISWRSPSTPMAKEVDPKLVFDRLFGSSDKQENRYARARRDYFRKSVLDFVRDDTARLEKRLGQTDRRKLDEYFTSLREIERRLEHKGTIESDDAGGFPRPHGVPREFADHAHLLSDLLAVAFQTDSTRVATCMLASAGSNRSYPTVGVPEGHHELSHHQSDPHKLDKLYRIDRFHVELFTYFLDRLATIPEGEGTLLDHSLIVYGSGISDGNRHNNENLPVLLAGKGGGTVTPGRHLRYARETPMCNLFVSLMDRMGVSLDRFGDSTGSLAYL